jgi:TPR repeat protein
MKLFKIITCVLVAAFLLMGCSQQTETLRDAQAACQREDYVTGLRIYRQWAEKGSLPAQTMVGAFYLKGIGGVSADPAEAAKWVKKAAEQGEPSAQILLSSMCREGTGVAQDPVQALMWLILASNGTPEAKDLRTAQEKDMSPEQIEQARQMARDWKPRSS